MAEHRMFSKQFLDSRELDKISDSAFRLYIQLCVNSDDDGFINNAERITKSFGKELKDLDELWNENLIFRFSNGVHLIKHWRVHNQLQKDRYNRTSHIEEFKLITWNESDKIYRPCIKGYSNGLELIEKWFSNSKEPKYQLTQFDKLPPQSVYIVYPSCIQDVSKLYTQYNIREDSISKFNLTERSSVTDFSKEKINEDEIGKAIEKELDNDFHSDIPF
jgi:hypothetical protein